MTFLCCSLLVQQQRLACQSWREEQQSRQSRLEKMALMAHHKQVNCTCRIILPGRRRDKSCGLNLRNSIKWKGAQAARLAYFKQKAVTIHILQWLALDGLAVCRESQDKIKVGVQRLKLLNYWVCQLLAYTEESCVKFTAVREENHFYPGCVLITFHFRGSEAEACWRLLTSHRVEHKISHCVGRIKALRKHTSLGSWLLQQLSSNSSWNLTYRINLE